ncbi:g11564 [Coccomyxa elongata]
MVQYFWQDDLVSVSKFYRPSGSCLRMRLPTWATAVLGMRGTGEAPPGTYAAPADNTGEFLDGGGGQKHTPALMASTSLVDANLQ